jgi:nickel-type superoxide dismutase maturation protease
MLLLAKFKVIGHSMQPQIKDCETVLVSSIFYWFKNPQIGDIVAFRSLDKILIKRIINIQSKKYFLVGDNKKDSLDSRKLGLISREKIVGKVFYQF